MIVDEDYAVNMYNGLDTPADDSDMCIEDDYMAGDSYQYIHYEQSFEVWGAFGKENITSLLGWDSRNMEFKCYVYLRPISECGATVPESESNPFLDEKFDLREVIASSEPLDVKIHN